MADSRPEAWLRGPVPQLTPWLHSVVHTFTQVKEDIEALVALVGVNDTAVWVRPGGVASVGFHVRHIGGATDRLLTYARGEALSPEQIAFLKGEGAAGAALREVADEAIATIDRALAQVQAMPEETLLEARKVGRAGLPTTVLGLTVHAAEHALRHAAQATTTARIVLAPAVE